MEFAFSNDKQSKLDDYFQILQEPVSKLLAFIFDKRKKNTSLKASSNYKDIKIEFEEEPEN